MRSEAKSPVSDNDIAVSYIAGREKIALQRKAANKWFKRLKGRKNTRIEGSGATLCRALGFCASGFSPLS